MDSLIDEVIATLVPPFRLADPDGTGRPGLVVQALPGTPETVAVRRWDSRYTDDRPPHLWRDAYDWVQDYKWSLAQDTRFSVAYVENEPWPFLLVTRRGPLVLDAPGGWLTLRYVTPRRYEPAVDWGEAKLGAGSGPHWGGPKGELWPGQVGAGGTLYPFHADFSRALLDGWKGADDEHDTIIPHFDPLDPFWKDE